jgi:hypothetical protein
MVSTRRRFRDIKPYSVPSSLEDLRGPASGEVTLRHSVLWAPGDGRVNLDTHGGTLMAYQALLAEGNEEDQIALLNKKRLIDFWSRLHLDPRIRDLWESRFPQLRRSHD